MAVDIFGPWHEFLKNVKSDMEKGIIKTDVELTDFDLAVQYVIGVANQHGYMTITTDMIFHMIKAFTDVEWEE